MEQGVCLLVCVQCCSEVELMSDSPTPEVGPVYGVVPLIDSLPLGTGIMRQAMPSRGDLERVYKSHAMGARRVVASYEILLSHYQRLVKEAAANASDLLGDKGGEEGTDDTRVMLLDAIMGVQVGSISHADYFTKKGLMVFSGNQWNEDWKWNRSGLMKLTTGQLQKFYEELKRKRRDGWKLEP